MSSTPKQPIAGTTKTTAGNLLSILAGANGYVTLAIEAAGVIVPLAKGFIQKIEGIGAGSVTITFTELIAADTAELDAITKLSTDELTAVNAELARLGLPPLPAPPAAS